MEIGSAGKRARMVRVGSAACPNGHRFAYLSLGDMQYGLLLARTRQSTALVRATEDPVFGEIMRVVDELAPELPPRERARAVQGAFAEACDPDGAGDHYSLSTIPCPTCGADAIDWDDPPDAEPGPTPPEVTHRVWATLDAHTRRALVARAVNRAQG